MVERFQKEKGDIMTCSVCRREMTAKVGEIELRIHGELFLAKNIPYEECTFCGERVISPKVSQDIYDKIQNKTFIRSSL